MIKFCDKENIRIVATDEPCTCVRTISPLYTEEEIKDIKKKPYLNKKNVTFIIWANNEEYRIFIPKGYTWDGSSCPTLHNVPTLLTASCLHDKLCECPWLINYDRNLSSIIFREMGIAGGMNKMFMSIAYHCVDNYQKIFCHRNWKK